MVNSSASDRHSTSSTNSAVSSINVPNFRLAELSLNAFAAMRAYRTARQCLIAYGRITSGVFHSAPNELLPLALGDDGKIFPDVLACPGNSK